MRDRVVAGLIAVLGVGFALAPTLAGASAPEKKAVRAVDLCVVLPGFDKPPDTFVLEIDGPEVRGEPYHQEATFNASACGSIPKLPAGEFTITQTTNPPQWFLNDVYCYVPGNAQTELGEFNPDDSSITLEIQKSTSCIFAELPTGSSPSPTTRPHGSTTSTTSHGTTTSTTKGTTTTTKKLPPKTFVTRAPVSTLPPFG